MESVKNLSVGSDALYDSAIKRANRRIVPFLFVCFVLNYIDRINVGFGKLGFSQALGFSDQVFGIGVSLFFIGFILFEIPSNMLLARQGARFTLARIMVIWGSASFALAWMETPTHFYILRFLLGIGEAGFVPGVLLYLSYWYPPSYRARITSLFFMALPISSIIGNPLSGYIMSTFNQGQLGLQNWQWLFILEGVPSVLVGLTAYIFLTDKPKQATWLSDGEKNALLNALESAEQNKATPQHTGAAAILKDPRVYVFIFAVFSQYCVANIFAFWAPSMLKEAGVTNAQTLGLISAIPFVVGTIFMLTMARHSDRKMERRWHAGTGQLLTVVGLLLLAFVGIGNPTFIIVSLLFIVSGHYCFWSIFFTIPPTYFRAGSAPVGIAIITAMGGLGGVFASNFIGWVKTSTGSFQMAVLSVAVISFAGAITFILGAPASVGNVKKAAPQ